MSYLVSDALQMAQAVYGSRSTIFEQLGPTICDIAQSLVWNFADWRQTMAEFPPFWLTPLIQDYGSPYVPIPLDFQGFRKMHIVQTATEPEYRDPIEVKKTIEATYIQGIPEAISYESSIGKARLYPRVPDFTGAAEWLIDGTYKKSPTKITASNLGSAVIPISDRFFDVYRKAVVYAYLDIIGDPRVGQTQWNKQQRIYVATGALGALKSALQDMAESEAIDLGDDSIAPSEPLIPYGCY